MPRKYRHIEQYEKEIEELKTKGLITTDDPYYVSGKGAILAKSLTIALNSSKR